MAEALRVRHRRRAAAARCRKRRTPIRRRRPRDRSPNFTSRCKFPEDLLGGTFANAVMIRHTPEEFCFDFISSLYPRPIVVSRVFAAAGRVPSFIDAMAGSLERYQSGGGASPTASSGDDVGFRYLPASSSATTLRTVPAGIA